MRWLYLLALGLAACDDGCDGLAGPDEMITAFHPAQLDLTSDATNDLTVELHFIDFLDHDVHGGLVHVVDCRSGEAWDVPLPNVPTTLDGDRESGDVTLELQNLGVATPSPKLYCGEPVAPGTIVMCFDVVDAAGHDGAWQGPACTPPIPALP